MAGSLREAEAGGNRGRPAAPGGPLGPGRGGQSGASWRSRGSRTHFWRWMRRPREGSGNDPTGPDVQAEGLPVPDSNPWAMGTQIPFRPRPRPWEFRWSSAMPPGAQSGVCDATALDSLEICPVVQESPVWDQQCPVYNTLGACSYCLWEPNGGIIVIPTDADSQPICQ